MIRPVVAPRRLCVWLVAGLLVAACSAWSPGAAAGPARRPPAGPLVTIYAPQRQQLELALDEVELSFPAGQAGATDPAVSAVETTGTRLDFAEGRRAIFALTGVTDLEGLQQRVAALAAVNPSADAALVAYLPGVPKGSATLRLVTHEVGLVLEPGQDVGAATAGLPAGPARPVSGVPSGYVIATSDPFTALDLAEALRQRPGVVAAYPIVRRLVFGR